MHAYTQTPSKYKYKTACGHNELPFVHTHKHVGTMSCLSCIHTHQANINTKQHVGTMSCLPLFFSKLLLQWEPCVCLYPALASVLQHMQHSKYERQQLTTYAAASTTTFLNLRLLVLRNICSSKYNNLFKPALASIQQHMQHSKYNNFLKPALASVSQHMQHSKYERQQHTHVRSCKLTTNTHKDLRLWGIWMTCNLLAGHWNQRAP